METGYNKEGYDREGFDRDGFDSEGYTLRGFNKDGYDRQGYNIDGDYRPFIKSYLVKNEVVATNVSVVYSDRVKNILWELNEAEKALGYEMYDSAARALRSGAEFYTNQLCELTAIHRGFPDKFKRLQFLKDKNIIDCHSFELLNQARSLGNMSSHNEKSERKIEKDHLKELYLGIRTMVHCWIKELA
ncbi:DUF4145 domain-containing protein [Neobacillus sp. SuZ13]|uniref:DUF4145 domain-containing protein n=1 Tax=Neobacillus sp. SuZ13 TaxID=3047875 RepID=UPI0024C02B5E|nr:DUF4145 domain-containing protein [Neobacillus sp. SuZ13]WHY64685.1 hypothetical protein QNH17_16290 [Neobacillus sp. SuZ13]